MKKVLLVSYIALMDTTPNGRTMKSLLDGLERENIVAFNVIGFPDSDSCSAAYKMSNGDVLHSIFKLKEFGGECDLNGHREGLVNGFDKNETRSTPKNAWKYLFRELAWKFGRTHGKRFKKWLLDQKPDCVLYMYGDSPSLQDLSVFISRFLNIPLIVYSCENYCFKDYNFLDHNQHSLPFFVYKRMSLASTKKMFKRTSALICNSDELGELFDKKYHIGNVHTVTMGSSIQCAVNTRVRSVEDTRVVYMGAIGYYRTDALVNIANALSQIDPSLKLDVYGRVNDPEILAKFDSCESLRYNGFVSYEQVQQITHNAALNLEVINIDPIIERNKKFGLSTKFADALICGTPFLLYAPEDMVETHIAREYDCAFVVTDNSMLVETLKIALFDENARKKQVENAIRTSKLKFDKEKNIEIVNNVLSSI